MIAPQMAAEVEYGLAGDGPPVVVIHGTPGGYDQAIAGTTALAERGLNVIAPSRPGYLGTSIDVGRTPAEQADAIVSLLNDLGVQRPAILGMSGGGPVALEMALRHRDRVRALVLASAVTMRYAVPGSTLGRRLFMSDGMAWLLRRMYASSPMLGARALIGPLSTRKGQELGAHVQAIMNDPEGRRTIDALVGTMTQLSERRAGMNNDIEQLARLRDMPIENVACPVLVVHGRADARVPLAHAEHVASRIKHAALIAIDDGSHLCQIGPGAAKANAQTLSFLSAGR